MEINNSLMNHFEESLLTMGFANRLNSIEEFLQYRDLLQQWNSKINLISSTTMNDILGRHFLDSLSITLINKIGLYDLTTEPLSILDVGTGAGFPGIPMKIMYPKLELTLLDTTIKKIDFLKTVCKDLTFSNVNFISDRAESAAHLKPYRAGFDLVVARAVADLKILVELMLPFCKAGGALVAMKGAKAEEEISDASYAIALLGGGEVELIKCSDHYPFLKGSLVFIRKIGITPNNYPRKIGIPNKRPLSNLRC
jgi:16S rRNA (guanine527-N7)-methyltransferase